MKKDRTAALERALYLLRSNGDEVAFGWAQPNRDYGIFRIFVRQNEDGAVQWRFETDAGWRDSTESAADAVQEDSRNEAALRALAALKVTYPWRGDTILSKSRFFAWKPKGDEINSLLFVPIL